MNNAITEIIEVGRGDFVCVPGYYLHEIKEYSNGNKVVVYRQHNLKAIDLRGCK